jgi:molecular chaperone GrpE
MSGDTIPDSDFPVDSGDTSAEAQAAAAGAESPAPDVTPAEAASAAGSDGSAQAGAEDRAAELYSRLAALQAEHEALRGQYMRMAADFDNFRKRQSRDQDDLKLQITCTTLSEILPVVDNFDRARQQLNPQSEEALGLHRSYQGLYRQLVDVFKQLGVSPMRVEGEPFDPSLHEAVLRAESDEHPEDVEIEELQRGYHLNGRVLRHALVKVSMGPGPAAGQAPAAPEEQAG